MAKMKRGDWACFEVPPGFGATPEGNEKKVPTDTRSLPPELAVPALTGTLEYVIIYSRKPSSWQLLNPEVAPR